jgi:hypothetical protein
MEPKALPCHSGAGGLLLQAAKVSNAAPKARGEAIFMAV